MYVVARWYVVSLYVRHPATGEDDNDAGVGEKHMLYFLFLCNNQSDERNANKSFRGRIFSVVAGR